MARLLRAVRQSRWERDPDASWLGDSDVQADALLDLGTDKNTLSVYEVPEGSGPEPVIFALAANRDNFSNFDYITFEKAALEPLAVIITGTMGKTAASNVNQLHRDLSHLTATRVAQLAAMAAQDLPPRINWKDVKAGILQAIKLGEIELEQVNEKLKPKILAELEQSD